MRVRGSIYQSESDVDTRFWDQYYQEKSWSKRVLERQAEMRGDFLRAVCVNDADQHVGDIHPVFKIKRSSSEEDFKKVYRQLILETHPDKTNGCSQTTANFIKIRNAWLNLSFNKT